MHLTHLTGKKVGNQGQRDRLFLAVLFVFLSGGMADAQSLPDKRNPLHGTTTEISSELEPYFCCPLGVKGRAVITVLSESRPLRNRPRRKRPFRLLGSRRVRWLSPRLRREGLPPQAVRGPT